MEERDEVSLDLLFFFWGDPGLKVGAGWSFSSLFGKKLERSCPVASSSTIEISLPPTASSNSSENTEASPALVPGPNSLYSNEDRQTALYNVDLSMCISRDCSSGRI